MKPRIGILDPKFVYRDACTTDIRATFERVRKELATQKQTVVKLHKGKP